MNMIEETTTTSNTATIENVTAELVEMGPALFDWIKLALSVLQLAVLLLIATRL